MKFCYYLFYKTISPTPRNISKNCHEAYVLFNEMNSREKLTKLKNNILTFSLNFRVRQTGLLKKKNQESLDNCIILAKPLVFPNIPKLLLSRLTGHEGEENVEKQYNIK